MRRFRLAVLLMACVFATRSQGGIDTKNLNYTQTWIDIEAADGFRVERTYNSRSLYDGAFGFGWCSDFETRLDVVGTGFVLVTCGAGSEIALERRLTLDGRTVIQNADGSYVLDQVGAHYILSGGRTTNMTFDSDGTLIRYRTSDGGSLMIERVDGRIAGFVTGAGDRYEARYTSRGKIARISGKSVQTSYVYNENGGLKEVTNMWDNRYRYTYDSFRNLTKASYPDDTSVELTYDRERDWVTSFRDRDGCLETYVADFDTRDQQRHYWITLTKKCEEKITNKSRFEFVYDYNTNGEFALWRNRTTVNSRFVDTEFNLETGDIVRVEKRDLGKAFVVHLPLQ